MRYGRWLILVMIACVILSACGTITSSEKQAILNAHNRLRHLHGVSALSWNNKLAFYAGVHALGCHFQHSHPIVKYGQNLAAGYPSVTDAINAWYSEIQYYSYANSGYSKKTGHFTQLVWKSTTEIGCAYVFCDGKNGTYGHYLVCDYQPAGNVMNPGYFVKNVLPPSSL